MLEFLQAYGSWILFGLIFVVMMRLHGSMGCGMGGHKHDQADQRQDSSGRQRQGTSVTEEGNLEKPEMTPAGGGPRSGGCH